MIFPLQINSGKALACSSALLQEIGSEDMMEAVNNKGQTLRCFQRCEHQVSISPTCLTAAFTCPDPKKAKTVKSSVSSLCFWDLRTPKLLVKC